MSHQFSSRWHNINNASYSNSYEKKNPGRWLTKSAEIQAETPLSVDILEPLFKHFDVAHRVEHDVDDDRQCNKACYSHPCRIQ